MKKASQVWVLVTYSRWSEDEISVYAKRADAESAALACALDYWPSELGDPPATYDAAMHAWEKHDLWGADDSKWELVCVPIQ